MINDIFESTETGHQLYTDDGAIWKKEKHVLFVLKAIQNAIEKVKIMLNVGH